MHGRHAFDHVRSHSSRRDLGMPDGATHRIRDRTTIFVVSAVSEALSGPLITTDVRYACDSPSNPGDAAGLLSGDNRNGRTALPARLFPGPDEVHPRKRDVDDAALILTGPARDRHVVLRPDCILDSHSDK